MSLRTPESVQTAPVTALGLIGGYLVARETEIRPLGGVLLGGAGLLAGRSWLAKTGPATTAALGVTTVSAAASHLLSDRR